MLKSLDCHVKGKTTSPYLHSFTLLGENNDLCANTQLHDFAFCCQQMK